MSQADNASSIIRMIPAPPNWQTVRSAKSIPGMSDAEKLEFQKTLRLLKGKHLDESKLYAEQDSEQLKKVADAVCAQCPFLLQRYEGAWPIEALLRSRLQTSVSSARRPGSLRSPKAPKASRMKPNNGASTSIHASNGTLEGEMKDELDSSPELEEHLPPQRAVTNSQPTAPSSSTQSDVQAQERAGDAQHSSSREDTPPPATPAAEPAESAPRLENIRALVRSPRHAHFAQRPVLKQSVTKPRQEHADARALPTVASYPTTAALRTRLMNSSVVLAPRSDVGAVPAAPRPPSSVPSDASGVPAAPRQPSPVSSDATAVQYGQDGDAGERVVRDFLHSLVQPLDGLLPMFLQAGIRDEACLKALAGLSQEQKLQLLRADLELNILQSRIILDGLSRIS
ncbi:hypothetical protein PsYK624_064630 [Phanerochaete sordida]|uniref:Uncharacterized protein n=1 Tax=Phanerochaete sordida TaxID=48140 RepID=A0A9P3G6T0_9APHY|nr:hypothetical protein PsYK624_064630 [Phanerochaete sordida]